MLDTIKKDKKIQLILIFMILFILGMAVSGSYGSYVDQYTETNISGMNLKEYMYRLLGEDKPHDRMEYMFMISFGNIGRISESVEKDHGVAPYYPVGMLVFLQGRTAFTSFVWHYYTFFLYFAGCLGLYGIVYELFKRRRIALLSFLMLYLSPRFFGEGHYNNKDIVLMAFGLLTLCFGIRYIQRQKLTDGLLFAAMAAVMTNIKIIGMWFFGVVGITYLIYHIYKKTLTRKNFLQGIGVIFFYFFFFMLITPASWDGLVEYVQYCITGAASFSRWDGKILYAGKWYTGQLPWHYLPVEILISTPPVLLLLMLFGHIRAAAAIVRREKNAGFYGLLFVVYLLPFAYAVLNRSLVVYNGWRHFYFIYGPLMVFAAVGLGMLERLPAVFKPVALTKENRYSRIYNVLCGGVVAYLMILVIAGHPYQYSYVNCFAAEPAEEKWELDYWNVTGYQALKKLYYSKDRNRGYDLTVGAVNNNQSAVITNLDMLPEKIRESITYLNGEEDEPNYIVVNLSYGKMTKEGYHYLFDVQAYGNSLFEVYEKDDE